MGCVNSTEKARPEKVPLTFINEVKVTEKSPPLKENDIFKEENFERENETPFSEIKEEKEIYSCNTASTSTSAFDVFKIQSKCFTKQELVWRMKNKLLEDVQHSNNTNVPNCPTTVPEIVQRLCGGSAMNDVSAIVCWICANITLDNTLRCQSEELILAVKKTNNEGMCRLFDAMCRYCNIKSRTIRGLAKGPTYYPGYKIPQDNLEESNLLHFWNKVLLGNRWYLLDICWTAAEGQYLDEVHFICEPIAFSWLHLPLDADNDVVGKDQLLAETWKTIDFWAAHVMRTPLSRALGVIPDSHSEGLVRADCNKVHMVFTCSHHLRYTTELVEMKTKEDKSDYVMTYVSGNELHIKCQLPGIGVYFLTVRGRPVCMDDDVKIQDSRLFLYTVMGLNSKQHPPYPKIQGTWGTSPAFRDAKFNLLKIHRAHVSAENGKAVFSVVVPTLGWFPMTYKYLYQQDTSRDLSDCLYAERDMNIVTFFAVCPSPGEYTLSLTIPVMYDTEVIQDTSNFLISAAATSGSRYPAYDKIWGPTHEAANMQLNFKEPSSTILCRQGTCEINVTMNRKLTLSHRILSIANAEYENNKCVYMELMGNETIFHIRIPDSGWYKFEITATEADAKNSSNSVVAVYLLDIKEPYTGTLFEENREKSVSMGVSSTFSELGLVCNYPNDTISPNSPVVVIEFTGQLETLTIDSQLVSVSGPEIVECDCYATVKTHDLMQFVISVPKSSQLRFTTQMVQLDDGTSLSNHLINPSQTTDDHQCIEPATTFYGPQSVFPVIFTVPKDHPWFLTSEDGTFNINQTFIKFPQKEFSFEIVKNGLPVKGALLTETSGNEVSFNISVPSAGFWRFTGFDEERQEIFNYLLRALRASEARYPHHDMLWGINQYGRKLGMSFTFARQPSTIKCINSKADLALKLKQPIDIVTELVRNDEICDNISFWVERTVDSYHVTVSPPVPGMYTLNLYTKTRETVGKFLVLAADTNTLTYPRAVNFYSGCKLNEPKINPLTRNADCYFEMKVPGVEILVLRDENSTWKHHLLTNSGVFKGMVNVKDAKQLYVVAVDKLRHEKVLMIYDII